MRDHNDTEPQTDSCELWKFPDLQRRQIAENWVQLKRLQLHFNFPRGFLLSPGRRVWRKRDIEAWVASREAAQTEAA